MVLRSIRTSLFSVRIAHSSFSSTFWPVSRLRLISASTPPFTGVSSAVRLWRVIHEHRVPLSPTSAFYWLIINRACETLLQYVHSIWAAHLQSFAWRNKQNRDERSHKVGGWLVLVYERHHIMFIGLARDVLQLVSSKSHWLGANHWRGCLQREALQLARIREEVISKWNDISEKPVKT